MHGMADLMALAREHAVTKYAERVVSGKLRGQCGKWEILACKRHLADLDRAGTKDFPFVFDVTRADRIYRHFAMIPRLDAPGEKLQLEDWQQFDFGSVMGWVHRDSGKRRFKRAYTRIARGHAKTTTAAGIALYTMLGDALYPPGKPEKAEWSGQPIINIVATDRRQGNTMRDDIANMAKLVPAFASRLDVKNTYIRNRKRGGSVDVFSRDVNNKDGSRPDLVMIEEWHAHTDSRVRDVAVSGLGKKPQCLEYIITTAGADAENKPCFMDDQQYKQVLEGNAERICFVMIAENDDDEIRRQACCQGEPFSADTRRQSMAGVVESQYGSIRRDNPRKIRSFLIKRMTVQRQRGAYMTTPERCAGSRCRGSVETWSRRMIRRR